MLQHAATHCNTPQHPNINKLVHDVADAGKSLTSQLQHAATRRNTLQHTLMSTSSSMTSRMLVTILRCQLQHTATRCNTLQHTATQSNWCQLQHTSTRCNTLQHAATRCNTVELAMLKNQLCSHVALSCSLLQCVAVCCSVLSYSVLQCVAACCS